MSSNPLRSFLVYFKDGTSATVKAASFKMELKVLHRRFFELSFQTENGENRAVYINSDEVAAILPSYLGEYSGQTFTLTFKSTVRVEVRADNFTSVSDEWFSFRNADGSHIPDVWASVPEVLACIPTIGLPAAFQYPKPAKS